jgi:16S rRNA (cytidine1402-2'-O)-methyltransferase
MSGTLFVVATPIGNLEDITFRAVRVLRDADVIAAEDTRRTGKLLAHYSIQTSVLSFHEHNTRTRIPQLLARLTAGASIALVSDAGTPGISDPGVELIRACSNQSIPVDPIPGPSAPIAAAVVSGFPLEPLTIHGFVPARSQARKRWLEEVQARSETVTFFETPHRMTRMLSELPIYFGDRPIMIAREITKSHQEFIRFESGSVIGQMPVAKGEFTIVLGPRPSHRKPVQSSSDELIYENFCEMTKITASSRRAAVVAVANKHGRSPKEVYAIVERFKKAEA